MGYPLGTYEIYHGVSHHHPWISHPWDLHGPKGVGRVVVDLVDRVYAVDQVDSPHVPHLPQYGVDGGDEVDAVDWLHLPQLPHLPLDGVDGVVDCLHLLLLIPHDGADWGSRWSG